MSPSWLSYAEIYHCRWAMLGAAGCIFPEIFANLGIIPQTPSEVTWFRAGVFPPAGSYNLYWTGTLPGSQAWTHHHLPLMYCQNIGLLLTSCIWIWLCGT